MRELPLTTVAIGLLLATSGTSGSACTIEINEIARFINHAESIVAGQILSVETSTYRHPEDADVQLEVAESAVMRVAQVLKGSTPTPTIDLRFDPGEPDWETSCGPYLGFYGYRTGRHYLLTLGPPEADGTYRKSGFLGQSVIRLPDSEAGPTGLLEYVRYVAETGQRPVELRFAGRDSVFEGEAADVEITVTNRLILPITVSTGGGPHDAFDQSHALLTLGLERLGGRAPASREDRPDTAAAVFVGAGATRSFVVRLADYFELEPGGHGLEGNMHLGLTSEPGGPTFRDFWGNFGHEYRFEVVRRATAVRPVSWGLLKAHPVSRADTRRVSLR